MASLLPQNIRLVEQKIQALKALQPIKQEFQKKLDDKFRLEFNFNSNHIEGNTLTYGETELLLIFNRTEGEHELREYEEMKAHDVALKMIEEEATDKERPLTENFIRTLNQFLLVRPFWKEAITEDGQQTQKQIIPGQYKTLPNSVRLSSGEIFDYTSPNDVPLQMQKLVEWYNSNSTKEHPIVLASLLHYRFVRIHPFDDGNGRVARLLMNYALLKSDYPIVVIKSSEKKNYLFALNKADVGNTAAFVQYITDQLLWSLEINIKAANGEDFEEEEDLDKELDLLKRSLQGIPDEFDKRKTDEGLSILMDRSIIPLFKELHNNLEKVSNLFVEIDDVIVIKYVNRSGNTISRTLNLTKVDSYYQGLSGAEPFVEMTIKEISIGFSCIALKKVSNPVDLSYGMHISLEDYHYRIIDVSSAEPLIKVPYGRYLNKENVKKIVKFYMYKLIENIKENTNLKS